MLKKPEDITVFLTIFPYWDPMIPPMGITSLKQYLQQFGYKVVTEDLIVKKECLDFYTKYFDILAKNIPEEKQGNFRNIGHDVLQNQLMAHINYTNKANYYELFKELIYQHYYHRVNDDCIEEMSNLTDEFYSMLKEYFIKRVETIKPDVIGATFYKCTVPVTLYIFKEVRKKFPHIKLLAGGGTFNESHAPDSPSFDGLLDYSKEYVDHYFLGQGELLILKYLKGELPEKQRVYTRDDIGGEILGFNEQSIPDFSDLNLAVYPCMAATSSSSCIYNCSFCVSKKVNGEYRKKESKLVVEQMTQLYKQHGHQLFFMTDSLINPVITDLANEFINSNIALYYDAYFKVDDQSADINNTLLWRKGGLYRVRLGTESGSQKILDEMSKLITPDQIRATVKALAYAGVKVTTYWVIGHPGETEDDFQQTLDLIEELRNDIYQAECNYFLYHYSKQAKGDEWAKHRMPLYSDQINDMLIFKHWTLDLYPLREEAFKRVHRFEAHCRRLGIPNPYSLSEYYLADKRWSELHKNAAPPLAAFRNFGHYIDECKHIKQVDYSSVSNNYKVDFTF